MNVSAKIPHAEMHLVPRNDSAGTEPWTWGWICAWTRYLLWQLVSKGILGVIYLAVISEGLRVLIPSLGQKLYRLPLLGGLRDYEVTYRLDLAPFFAVFLLVAVFGLWPRIIAIWMSQHGSLSREQQLIAGLGIAILAADAVLFYYAMTQLSWGSSTLSFSALVATAAYVGVLVFVSWVSVKLHPRQREVNHANA